MACEINNKVVGRDRTGVPRQTLVDETSALVSSDVNLGIEYGMAFQTNTTGSYLQLTTDNTVVGTNTLTFVASGLVPLWGTARPIYITTNTAGLVATVKCYGIDLAGNEKIFYVNTNGTANITTGSTEIIGGTAVNLSTDLRHINRMQDVAPRSSGVIYARATINNILTTLVMLGHYYEYNPIYCCPTGRRAKFKGFQMISASAANDYEFIVFKKSANLAVSTGHPISFPLVFRINDFSALSQNSNDYQWSDEGLVSIDEGGWLFLNRISGGTQTNLTAYATISEYKI